jgi:hypothetical protein
MKRHPDGSEGCLAIARQDRLGCRPEPTFFVTPSEARGPSALAHLGKTSRDAVPNEVRDARLALGRTGWDVAPSASEGSLGACAPRDDIPGRRPERSEGCTACARQDRLGGRTK